LLEGKTVNLRIVEKDDLKLLNDWRNDPEFFGEFILLPQMSRMEREKWYENLPPTVRVFYIEKKDGTKIGNIAHFMEGNLLEIGYGLAANERRKGYCSEAVQIMVDYLFLSRDLVRIQAHTDTRNLASQKVLVKVGFQKEVMIRKGAFVRGKWRDFCLFSILREEWKEPKILTKTT
jgi:RimJ/RimL family protein N-acetyltransferase